MPKAKPFNTDDIVNKYFQYIRELRNGDESAVDRLVDLWAQDGVFEFGGAVTGTFKGRNAIHVLYTNRLKANGMPLDLQPSRASLASAGRQVALGLVDTEIKRTRALTAVRGSGNRVAVGWTTVVGTSDKRGFQVSGSHSFTFKGGKISALKVAVAPKPQKSDGLSLEGLAVADIGRLALAAWAVV